MSGISQFLGGAICCLVVWAVLGMVGGKAALTCAIILVPLVTSVAGILTIAFVGRDRYRISRTTAGGID